MAAGLGGGDEAAEVGVAAGVLGEQGQVGAVGQGQLGAGEWWIPAAWACLGELHRAVEAVVIGDGEGVIAEIAGTSDRSSAREAPSRKEKAVCRWSSTYGVGMGARMRGLYAATPQRRVFNPALKQRKPLRG